MKKLGILFIALVFVALMSVNLYAQSASCGVEVTVLATLSGTESRVLDFGSTPQGTNPAAVAATDATSGVIAITGQASTSVQVTFSTGTVSLNGNAQTSSPFPIFTPNDFGLNTNGGTTMGASGNSTLTLSTNGSGQLYALFGGTLNLNGAVADTDDYTGDYSVTLSYP